jgi:hypothetical protein
MPDTTPMPNDTPGDRKSSKPRPNDGSPHRASREGDAEVFLAAANQGVVRVGSRIASPLTVIVISVVPPSVATGAAAAA